MADLSRRRFLQVAGLGAASVAVLGAAAGCSNGGSGGDGEQVDENATVDTNVEAMAWDQVLAEADGQTVTMLAWGSGGADAFVQQWWEHLAETMAEKYNITLQYGEFDEAEYSKITTDLENGADATYDMFWYTGAMTAPIRAVDGAFTAAWLPKLDNYKYLDPANNYVTFDGTQGTDSMESPFQGLNPSLVYSTDLWDAGLAWDAEEGGKKGLFHNFTELAQWVKKNPGKFTYMDLTGAGSFHSLFFLKAILAELTDDGNGGWTAVYDEADDEATRREKINAHIKEWYDWSVSEEASEEAFHQKAAYLWAYLNELEPDLLQGDAGPLYLATAPDMMQYVMAGDLACTFTTCTSIAARVAAAPDSYMANPAIYMLQTSVGAWDYVIIMSNSVNKAGAMVVANEMINPEEQAIAFQTTGNGYNVSYDLLDADQKAAFDDVFAEMGALSPSAEEIAAKSYTDMLGNVAAWIPTGWTQYVVGA